MAGSYIYIAELNDSVNKHIDARGDEGAACGGMFFNPKMRCTGQILHVTGVAGNVLTIEEPLVDSFNNGPLPDWQPNHTYQFGTALAVSQTGHVYAQTLSPQAPEFGPIRQVPLVLTFACPV